MQRLIPLLLVVFMTACAGTSPHNTTQTQSSGGKNTPSYVVTKFLDAFVKNDFGTAFKYIHSNATDRQGYVSRMKNLVEQSNNRITNFNLMGTRIIGDIAYAIVELEIQETLSGGNTNIRYTKNQYELTTFDGKWKIVKDHGCVENCTDKKG
ncbi:MAG: hypothetical protein GWO07_15810 [Candidatus Dadabacteria bacterium]|nr:hypothetical protein [Candidatus Dadabacteria bacterium]NIS10175.1 hypothetical protein [Candidatus Dadabacteria bacterium]NIY23087.1 hypothetical protein [Candidatus Dadabacteria bacterium]